MRHRLAKSMTDCLFWRNRPGVAPASLLKTLDPALFVALT
jgi:hypothetical protein